MLPERLWAANYPLFLPDGSGLGLLALALALIVGPTLLDTSDVDQPGRLDRWLGHPAAVWILAGVVLWALWALPIEKDRYGDAPFLVPPTSWTAPVLEQERVDRVLDWNLINPKIGTDTTVSLVYVLSYFLQQPIQTIFVWLGLAGGLAFALCWLALIRRLVPAGRARFAAAALGLMAPLTQGFAGHMEVYAPVYALLALYWLTAQRWLSGHQRRWGIALLAVTACNVKFHITGAVLVPVTLLLLAHRRWPAAMRFRPLLTRFLLPIYAGGAAVYFGVTKSAFGPRSYTETNLYDAIFLPIRTSDPAPMDRYDLFSANHLIDVLNLPVLWSAAAVLIVLLALLRWRRRIDWSQPMVVASGMAMLVYLPTFFVLNPLLGMPQDWDLFMIPAVALLVLSAAVLGQLASSHPTAARPLLYPIIAFALLAGSGLAVNASATHTGPRLILFGQHQFKTAYQGASSPIKAGIDRLPARHRAGAWRQAAAELEPFALPGKDIEYSGILNHAGRHFAAVQGSAAALPWFLAARAYAPFLRVNVFDLTLCHFRLGNYPEALALTQDLVAVQYPGHKRSLQMAVHIAVAAGDREAAIRWATLRLKRFPDRSFINRVLAELEAGTPMPQVLRLFAAE